MLSKTKAHGVSLEHLQDALILGTCRKFVSRLNGGSPEPVASLAYFEPLISEIQEQPFPRGDRECLQLKARNPQSLKIVALLNKPAGRKIHVPVDYIGFDIPDAFVVGYGLDYDQRYRNLPDIHILRFGK